MPTPPVTPCDWPLFDPGTDPSGENTCLTCEKLETLTESQRDTVEDMAIDLLWNWTHRRFGLCTEEVRPCRISCENQGSTMWGAGRFSGGSIPQVSGWTPTLLGGEWYNIWCGACGISKCQCGENDARALVLPGPVNEITEVIVDGEILPASSYTLRNGTVWRTDGKGWPDCNDPVADPLAENSPAWTITYLRGYPVPVGGQVAAYMLTCELALALCEDDDCSLPQRVQSITREGVTMSILDGFEGLEEGKTGIWEIDAWIKSVNAPKVSPPQVFSPDLSPKRDLSTSVARGHRGMW